MEERLPPPPSAPSTIRPPLPLPPAADLETYVVQIPRDQIYRVPPPEHASILERYHRNQASSSATTCRRTLCWVAAIPVFLIVAAVATVLTVRATLYSPALPEFSVTRILAKNLGHPPKARPEFDVTLRARNPNRRLSVTYEGGGEASLVYKNKRVGQGRIRSVIEQGSDGAVDFPVVLAGNVTAISAEIEKGLTNGSTEKGMALVVEVAVEMRSWVRNERMNTKVSCDFRVKNSLMNKTKISFEECRTEFS